MHCSNQKKQKGFVALVSTLIISLILIGLTLTVSSNGFFTRFAVLNSEFKRVSLGLAESCSNVALLKVGQNYNYAPAVSGDVVTVGSNTCVIKSVVYSPEVNHQKTATIMTAASYHGAFSNVQISATVQNPGFTPLPSPEPNIAIHAWLEN